ncbi:MAG TPA: hypothetical protein DCZ69_05080 [Syntrophobacteraceae bacterium]|nr:hypothetical protein [Syntrophobacteraceae bacterium]
MQNEDDPNTQSETQSPASKVREVEKLASRLLEMSVNEKIKLAMLGDAEARRLLVRDSNRLVQMAILENPRLTDNEIISMANSRSTPEEMLRAIAGNRYWCRTYAVRLALVKNPKTPPSLALRMVGGLVSSDLKLLSNSKSISPAVAHQAKKLAFKNK